MLETFTETESSKHDESHRPVLAAALEVARKQGTPIIVAKLDRLSRDVHYISGLMKHRVPFIVALAAAKARGVKLGGLNAKWIENQREAAERAERLRPMFLELAGMSARKAAEELNRRDIPAPAGGNWFAAQIIKIRKWRGAKS